MQAVTGLDLKPVAATLPDYQRLKFNEKTYPGIIKKETCSIDGMLYKGLDQQAIERLDKFEDVMYERCLLEVQLGDKTEQAFVYVVRDEYQGCLSDKEWNPEEFKRKYLKLYLKRIAEL
jgi:gamma-glutamylcyclotransferase (GGCT)/AIG2-like uncharacterized protein YtfP